MVDIIKTNFSSGTAQICHWSICKNEIGKNMFYWTISGLAQIWANQLVRRSFTPTAIPPKTSSERRDSPSTTNGSSGKTFSSSCTATDDGVTTSSTIPPSPIQNFIRKFNQEGDCSVQLTCKFIKEGNCSVQLTCKFNQEGNCSV